MITQGFQGGHERVKLHDQKLLFARALQIFMPGTPLVWYLDLFAGANDYPAADTGGHKEINRSNLSAEEIRNRLTLPIVQSQLLLLKLRNNFPAFEPGEEISLKSTNRDLEIQWASKQHRARIMVDVTNCVFRIETTNDCKSWNSFSV